MSVLAPPLESAAEHLRGLSVKDADRELRKLRMLAVPADAGSAGGPPEVSSLASYLGRAIPVPPVLVEPNLFVRGAINVTVGRAGKGKTKAALNRLLAWSAGIAPYRGLDLMQPTAPLRVLAIENEGAAGLFQRDLRTMVEEAPFNADQRHLARTNFHVWGDGGYSGLKLDTEQGKAHLWARMEELEPDIVFLEPFRGLWSGEENDATAMNTVVDVFSQLATEFGCGVQVCHHSRKGNGATGEDMDDSRGSSVLEGVVAVMEHFKPTKGGHFRELSWSKNRHDDCPPPVRLRWLGKPVQWYEYVTDATSQGQLVKVLTDADGDALGLDVIAEELGESEDWCRKRLTKLADEEIVAKTRDPMSTSGRQLYRLKNADTPAAAGGLDC